MKSLPEYIVIDSEGLAACCADIAQSSVVAFDTEFVGEDTYVPDLCLVQVATSKALYILDPFECGSLAEFWALLADPKRLVVVHAGREEIRICQGAIGTPPGNLFDVQIAAGLVGLGYPLGYGPLIFSLLRKRLTKGETLTDWRKRPLTEEQIRYAYDDVRDLLAVWKKIDVLLKKFGRRDWAKEEFEHFTTRVLKDSCEVERWRRLKGASSLSRQRLAVLKEVYQWRDRMAAKKNRPVRTVMRDDLVIELAKRAPKTEEEISSLRGMGRADLTGILEAVNRARELSEDEWPEAAERDNDSHAVSLVGSFLNVVLADWCAKQELTMPLVATSAEIKQLVRCQSEHQQLPDDCSLMRGWRRQHVLPVLMEVLEGRRAVRVKALEGNSPLEYGHVRAINKPAE